MEESDDESFKDSAPNTPVVGKLIFLDDEKGKDEVDRSEDELEASEDEPDEKKRMLPKQTNGQKERLSSSTNKNSSKSKLNSSMETSSRKEDEDDDLNLPKEYNIDVTSLHQVREHFKNKPMQISWFDFTNTKLAVKYVVTDSKRHRRAWMIGFFTVFLVVVFTSLLQNAIDKSPIVFLKLSEDQVGEYDLLLTPKVDQNSQSFWLNSTDISEKLKDAPLAVGAAPRWVMLGRIYNALDGTQNTSTSILVIDTEKEKEINLGRGWKHPPLGKDQTHVTSSVLRSIGVKAQSGETVFIDIDFYNILTTTGAFGDDGLNTLIKELIAANVNLTASGPFANSTVLAGYIERTLAGLHQAMILRKEYLVVDGIDDPNGKYPKALGNVAMLEAEYLQQLVVQMVKNLQQNYTLPTPAMIAAILPFLPANVRPTMEQIEVILQQLNETIYSFQDNFDIREYALMVVVMYRDRFETYIQNLKKMTAGMIVFTNQVADAIGYDFPATFQLPLHTALEPLYYIRMFLDQIFTFVTVVLIVLGALLIYSLLLTNVEEKTYEYGMLRAMGMKQYILIQLLTLQSLSFSVPAILIGLFLSFLGFIPVAKIIADFSISPLDVRMGTTAALLGVTLGLCMPLIAIVGPIRRALSHTLRDALDIYHQVQSETTVQIIKLEKMGLSPWQIAASVMMIAMGFVVYYVIPFAFTFQNLPLFFTVLILILLGMLLGLSLVGMTIQPYAERLAVYILLWGSDNRSLSQLVRKNLASHGRRNIKTAVMFTTSLAFIIFAGSSFSLQGHTISETVQLASGADLIVFSFTTALDENSLRNYLNEELARPNPLIRGFTFVTRGLDNTDFIRKTILSNLANFPAFTAEVYGVEENYLDTTYNKFFRPAEYDTRFKYNTTENDEPNVVRSLFTDAGKALLPQEENGIVIPPDITSDQELSSGHTRIKYNITQAYTEYLDVLISESLRDSASVDVTTPLRLAVTYQIDDANSTQRVYLCKPRALIAAFPGFLFSSYRQTANHAPLILSMDQYYKVMKDVYYAEGSVRSKEMPATPDKLSLRVRMKDNPTKDEREAIVNGMRNFITDDLIQVLDTTELVESTKVALDLLTLFFHVVSVIAVVLCFFVLWLSFNANIKENAWEFGVLRAVGLSSMAVIRMYIYEALCIIFTSVIIGATIGLLVSITLTLQFNLFTELPFSFDFPYALFFSVFGMSLFVAVVGSYIASHPLRKKDIALALKNM
eukprot:TRINITY_DN1253_c0_g3_i1.p1 TRINITY_DN1253_c0_g3~~TRINITY_DN1253_c0_g3_i1.p1  ORF type:complete len:1241 (+),score=361.47 TRINITY_DN1253_c0_g3_i1:25-3723(+)